MGITDVFGQVLALGDVEGVLAIEGPTDVREADATHMAAETLAIGADRGDGGPT